MTEEQLPPCPECAAAYAYDQGALLVCPMCGHEWNADAAEQPDNEPVTRDANGNALADGDDVVLVKSVKVLGGGGEVVKLGTKVRGVRLIDGVGDHDIDAKVPGFGSLQLKSSVVKKA